MNKKMSLRERAAVTLRGYRLLKKYCPGMVSGKAVSALISALQPLASIWFSAQIINEISDKRRLNVVIFYAAAVVLINLGASLIKSLLDKIYSEKETMMWSFFGKIFADKQLSMDYADLENAGIQQQRKQAEENLYMFGNGLGQLVWGVTVLVQSSVSIVVSLAMTVTLFTSRSGNGIINSPVWIGVILLCILLGGLCNSKAVIKENDVFNKWCKDTVWYNRMFKFYGNELYIDPERAKDLRIYRQNFLAGNALVTLAKEQNSQNTDVLKMSLYPSAAAVIIGFMNALCYIFVVLKAITGAFGVGSIIQYVGVLNRMSQGLQDFMYMLSDNEVYCTHLRSLFDYLDIPNKKYQGTLPVEKRAFCDVGDNDYEVEFRNVSFKYPGAENYSLNNISLKFRIGERLAIVGMNGSGKTTFIKLLCRLYDPAEGEILLNGIDIKKYDYNEYMSIFSVVFQDFKLFSFGLGQNVAADLDYNRSRAEECLRKAGFGDRLGSMPEGIDTCLYKDFDENGVEISGGEAQKIALARALYRDAPFMILDEPTAALDPIAEYEIYSKFNEIIGSKTAVFISHRLSSCRFCDDIAVFDNGRIIQRGSHNELVTDLNGKYNRLWNAQAQYYK